MPISGNFPNTKDWAVRTGIIAVILTALAAASGCAAGIEMPKGFEDDPLTVVRSFNDALNAKMIDAALGLVDEDVIFVDATGQAHRGKSPIRNWMQVQAQQNERSAFVDLWISGSTVIWTARIRGRDSLHMEKSEAVVQRGKIKFLKVLTPQ